MKQSKKHSLLEAVTSTLIGMGVSFTAQIIIFPIMGIDVRIEQNLILTTLFTAISIIRGYFVRRFFDLLT